MEIYFFSKDSTGGLSTFFNQINKLTNKEICFYFNLFKPPADIYKYKNLNYKISSFYLKNQSDSLFFIPIKLFFFIKDLLLTINLLKNKKNFIAFVCDLYSLTILSIIKAFFNIKFVLVFSINVNYEKLLKRRSIIMQKIIHLLTSFSIKKTDLIIFVSYGLKKKMNSFFSIKNQIKQIVVYPGVKISSRNYKIKKVLNKKPSLLYVGRLDDQKDLKTIIKAFRYITQQLKNTKLLIVGDGNQSKILKEIVNNLGLQKKIKFYGWRRDVNRFYKNADIFVFSSEYEGFGYTIIEAMSHKLPVITTNSPYGPSEILKKNQYGILIPIKKPKIMGKAILNLIKNKDLYNHYWKQAFIRAKYFSEEKMLKKYKQIFAYLFSRHNNNQSPK